MAGLLRCPDCGHEYLLAFSCKGRYFCTSCHTKRAAAFAEWLTTTVLKPVPHRQMVFTLPRMLRVWFRNDRRLLWVTSAGSPLLCPDCGGTMRIIAFIEIPNVIGKILRHLGLWDDGRPPPAKVEPVPPPPVETIYVVDDYVN